MRLRGYYDDEGKWRLAKVLVVKERFVESAIHFPNAADGYNEMWKRSHPSGGGIVEDAGFLVKGGGIVVLPTEGQVYSGKNKIVKGETYGRNSRGSGRIDYVPWEIKDGKYIFYVNGIGYEVLAGIHTHPNTGSWIPSHPGGDQRFVERTIGISTEFVFGEQGVGMGTIIPSGYRHEYIGSFQNLLNGSINLFSKIPQ